MLLLLLAAGGINTNYCYGNEWDPREGRGSSPRRRRRASTNEGYQIKLAYFMIAEFGFKKCCDLAVCVVYEKFNDENCHGN